jgi:transcriptional antiterminator NusG
MTKKWYVVHTYSGYEDKVKTALEETIKVMKKLDKFGEVMVPKEDVIEMSKGMKKKTKRKFFPGYILVQMDLDEETWHIVKGIPKVTGFVGGGMNPPSIPDEEMKVITAQINDGTLRPKPKVQFEDGESVRVIDGPFANFNGVVEEVKGEKGRLRVLISIFGRFTPVELDFAQVEKN